MVYAQCSEQRRDDRASHLAHLTLVNEPLVKDRAPRCDLCVLTLKTSRLVELNCCNASQQPVLPGITLRLPWVLIELKLGAASNYLICRQLHAPQRLGYQTWLYFITRLANRRQLQPTHSSNTSASVRIIKR